MTRTGYAALKKELQHLKTVERPKNIRAIEEARAHGDLSENAEFEAAKERQAFLESRTAELEYKIANAEVIDTVNLPKDRAVFGSSITPVRVHVLPPQSSACISRSRLAVRSNSKTPSPSR